MIILMITMMNLEINAYLLRYFHLPVYYLPLQPLISSQLLPDVVSSPTILNVLYQPFFTTRFLQFHSAYVCPSVCGFVE